MIRSGKKIDKKGVRELVKTKIKYASTRNMVRQHRKSEILGVTTTNHFVDIGGIDNHHCLNFIFIRMNRLIKN